MKYKLYGFYRLCQICPHTIPLAVGISHQNATLRLIKYRCLRKRYTPEEIRVFPKCFEIREIRRGLDWSVAYTLAMKYESENIKVLTCSRT